MYKYIYYTHNYIYIYIYIHNYVYVYIYIYQYSKLFYDYLHTYSLFCWNLNPPRSPKADGALIPCLAHARASRPEACGRRGRRARGAAAVRTCTEENPRDLTKGDKTHEVSGSISVYLPVFFFNLA